jgi:hypothetical protein
MPLFILCIQYLRTFKVYSFSCNILNADSIFILCLLKKAQDIKWYAYLCNLKIYNNTTKITIFWILRQ